MRLLSIFAFGLVAFAIAAGLVDGYFCTRIPWLLVAPSDILYGVGALAISVITIVSAGWFLWARSRKRTMPVMGWKWQTWTWLLLALWFFTNFDPRLSGLAIRAQTHEEALIDFSRKYRTGGMTAVQEDPVLKWCVLGFPAHVRSTPRFVEIWWGSTLPRSWGFRIDDQERPVPEFVAGTDDCAMAATERVTVFIGRY